MEVCPVCNGLFAVEKTCSKCGRRLFDAGVLQDFYDNYSAYLDRRIYEDGFPRHCGECCFHLFACPFCHADTILSFKQLDETEVLKSLKDEDGLRIELN